MKKFKLLLIVSLASSVFTMAQPSTTVFQQIDSLIANAEYPTALSMIHNELSKPQAEDKKALLQNKEAEIMIVQGNISAAESLLSQIKSNDVFTEAATLSNKGFLNLNRARFDVALEDLQTSLSKFKQSKREQSEEAATCLANLASVYLATGKYNQAEEYETIALQTRQKLFGEFSEEVAASYNNLGLIYLTSNPDKSLDYYEKALVTYKKLRGGEHPKIAIANTNIGMTYLALELYGDATNSFEAAKKIWERIYPSGHPNLAIVLRNLGRTYAKLKNEAAAIDLYKKAIAMYQKAYGEKHPDIASSLNDLGSILGSNREYDQALAAFQKSIVANAPTFSSLDINKNPIGLDYYNPSVMVYSLRLKAQTLESKYLGKTLKLADLKLALNCLYTCDSLIDDIRHHSSDESDKLALGELATEVYEDGVRIAHTISENVISPTAYEEKAFYFAEKSKSAVLQESIADTQAKSFSGIPSELLEQEKTIKATIANYVQKLAQKPSGEEEKKLREALFVSNNEYNVFVKKLEKDYPDYFNLKFSPSTVSVSDIQNTLSDQSAVVSYFLSEKNNQLFHFVITKNKFNVSEYYLPSDFARTLKGFSNSLFYSDFGIYKKAGNVISNLLLPSVSSKVKELIIIPAGRLGTLPFEALSEKKTKATDFESSVYWINRYAISYEFSANLLVQKKSSNAAISSPSIFLLAPINFPENNNLASLPGTEKEITNIANLFGGKSKAVKFADANESLIKSKELGSYNYLHFATHGVVDEENPASSRIFLSSNSTEDGNLYAGEIFNLNLNANLAVLSACQTGLGKISKGEGVIGLSRALIYAGAKNIVVSFWTVADESTAELMTNFYRDLSTSPNQDFKKALQKAKLKMIAEGKFANPYYWAPFVLIGG